MLLCLLQNKRVNAQQSELQDALQQVVLLSDQVDDLQVSRFTSHDCTCEVTAPYNTALAGCSQSCLHLDSYLVDLAC